jgi:hypothetical protein
MVSRPARCRRVFELGTAFHEDVARHICDLGRVFEQIPQELTEAEMDRLARQSLLKDAQEPALRQSFASATSETQGVPQAR